MSELSNFDKELIKRNEHNIKMLQEEKRDLVNRLLSIYKEIKSLRRYNRELKNKEASNEHSNVSYMQ